MKCYRYSHIAKRNVNPMYRKEPEADLEAEDWGGLSSLSSSSSFPFSSSSSSFLPPPFQLWLEIIGGAPMDFMELGGGWSPLSPPFGSAAWRNWSPRYVLLVQIQILPRRLVCHSYWQSQSMLYLPFPPATRIISLQQQSSEVANKDIRYINRSIRKF